MIVKLESDEGVRLAAFYAPDVADPRDRWAAVMDALLARWCFEASGGTVRSGDVLYPARWSKPPRVSASALAGLWVSEPLQSG
jgi:hypothetical protein